MFVSMLLAQEVSIQDDQRINVKGGSPAAFFRAPRGNERNVYAHLVILIAREGGDPEHLKIVTRIMSPDMQDAVPPVRQEDENPPPSMVTLHSLFDMRLEVGRYEVWLEINGERRAACGIGVVAEH